MTEDEAKTKWCLSPHRGHCIASACMAWRTRPVGSHQRHITPGGVEVRPPTNSVTLDGFCGLAGQP